ncbi:MAG: shikimate dehydrogenase, partial [Pseudomonadota bacterium]
VLGDPVSHSLSPVIHNHWIREEGLDATYEAMRVSADEFTPALDTLSQRDCVGFNVTLPHKIAAYKACSTLTEAASAIGAVNTLVLEKDGTWSGHNTDASGFLTALDMQGVTVTPETKVIVVGAGGAARAVVHALASIDVLPLILNRTEAKARQLSIDLTKSESVYGPISRLYDLAGESHIVINTISLGHEGKILNLPGGADKTFIDISYGAAAVDQLSHAKEMGWSTHDGLSMLIAQAAHSFEHWFGIAPQTDYILKHCRNLVETLA